MLTDSLFRFADNTTVLVNVGTEKTRFYVHNKFLCNASTFFEAALEGGFEEAESQRIELPEDKPEIVELFLEWLYTKEYRGPDEELLHKGPGNGIELRPAMDLFVFADKLGTQRLK